MKLITRDAVDFILCKIPSLYIKILNLQKSPNLEKKLYLKLIKKSDFVFDIGANNGYYTLLFSHLVGSQGQVHAFEPVPPTFEKLKQNINSRAKHNNCYLNNYVISDRQDLIEMSVPDDDFGQASLLQHKSGSWEDAKKIIKYQCESITLDSYLNKLTSDAKLQKLDFIKCDVEGAELLVLKGATHIIHEYSPVIFLEVCHAWTKDYNYQPVEIMDLLMSLGYSHFYLVDHNIRQIQDRQDLSEALLTESSNMLCMISDVHREKIKALQD